MSGSAQPEDRIPPVSVAGAMAAREESFSAGLLEYPHYTRPAEYRGWHVPDVLLSGHHERIGAWRRERSSERGERRNDADR